MKFNALILALLIIISAAAFSVCAPAADEPSASTPEITAGNGQETESEKAEQQDETIRASSEIAIESTEDKAEKNIGGTVISEHGPVVLVIKGDGVGGETAWTLDELTALSDGYRELTYSTTNNWPNYGHLEARGVSLTYLLMQERLKDSAESFKFTSTDGYYIILTRDQALGARYSYQDHGPAGSSGAFAVEPVIAWAWGEPGKVREENLKPFFGQSSPWDVNTSAFVKDLCEIEVMTEHPGIWPAPGASVASGAAVPKGTELLLFHDNMDSLRIYYTIDGSEPDYESLVYNQSTSYFQPELIKPLILTQSVTIKAFAAGYGKDNSPVVSFDYIVE